MQVKEKCKRISTYILSLALAICFIIFSKESIKEIKAGMVAIKGVSNYFTLEEPARVSTVADISVSDYGQYIDIGTEILTKTVALEDGTLPKSDWRVFKKENDGVWLILSDYMPNTSFDVTTVGLNKTTNTNYVKYGTYSGTDRIALINGLDGVISGKNSWNALISGSTLYSNGNLIDTSIKVKGAFNLEEWIESWNANSNYSQLEPVYYASAVSEAANTEGYKLAGGYTSNDRTTANTNGYHAYVNINSTTGSTDYNDTLYFPHHTNNSFDGTNYCYGYWLASPSASGADYVMFVGYDGSVNGYGSYHSYLGVRPAVFLPNNIELNTNGDVWTIKKTVADISVSDYGQYIDIGTEILERSNGEIALALEDGTKPKSDWRVFKKEDDGVWLILSDYMPNTSFDVTTVGLNKTTDTNYAKYGVRSGTGRIDLINGLDGVISGKDSWNALISGSTLYSNGNLIDTNIKVKGAFNLEEWIESWNANSNYSQLEPVYYASAVSGTANVEGYKLAGGYTSDDRTTANTNGYYAYVNINSTTGSTDYNDTLYFPHHTYNSFDGTNYCYGYWLASPSASSASNVMNVYCGGYVCGGSYYDSVRGVRPAVFLPNNIELNANGDVWTVVN